MKNQSGCINEWYSWRRCCRPSLTTGTMYTTCTGQLACSGQKGQGHAWHDAYYSQGPIIAAHAVFSHPLWIAILTFYDTVRQEKRQDTTSQNFSLLLAVNYVRSVQLCSSFGH